LRRILVKKAAKNSAAKKKVAKKRPGKIQLGGEKEARK
jgi:hypothetical protein